MPRIIPLIQKPNQTETVTLGQQVCQINVRQMDTGLFLDLYVGNEEIILGVICQNQNRCVRYKYLGFVGDLVFFDTQGSDDPIYTGLGTRWFLTYLTEDELIALGYTG